MNSESRAISPASVFIPTVVIFAIILAFLLSIFVRPLAVLAAVVGATIVWMVFARPLLALAILLAQMPFNYLGVMLGYFFGLPFMTLFSSFKDIGLLLVLCVLWKRNGFRFTTPDKFLVGFVFLAALHALLGGGILKGLQYDLEFALPYFAGRVTVLRLAQQELWARVAVWITAVIAVLGIFEVVVLGPGPRTLFYTTVSGEGELSAPFHAGGFEEGLRASSTMVGPLEFAALCMVGLILWWVYSRNPLPAALIAGGLICSVTRSATLGTIGAVSVLAYRLNQWNRLLIYSLAAITLFVAAVPIVGLSDYLSVSAKGQDQSTQTHRNEIVEGIEYVVSHPLGTGPGSVGPLAFQRNPDALQIENTYLAFWAEYGVLAALCFIGFLWSAFRMAWRNTTKLGHAATGILVGFSLIMLVLLIHQDFRLACWVWFPVGLTIRASSEVRNTNGSFC